MRQNFRFIIKWMWALVTFSAFLLQKLKIKIINLSVQHSCQTFPGLVTVTGCYLGDRQLLGLGLKQVFQTGFVHCHLI